MRRYSDLQVVLAALVAALLAGAPAAVIVAILMRLARVRESAVRELAQQLPTAFVIQRPSAIHADALAAVFELNAHRRASYLVQAATRLTRAHEEGSATIARAWADERRFLDQHLTAGDNRVEAAQRVEFALLTVGRGPLLGWRAVLDDRTSRECRAAHGRNFDARRVPPIGFPGTVHPNCRCIAVAPFATSRRVEAVRPDSMRAAA